MTGRTMVAGAAMAWALVAAPPTYAQEAAGGQRSEPAEATTLRATQTDDGDVVVTAPNYVPEGAISANKADIPLIQTPQSVSVITRDQIDLLGFVNAQQAVRYTAGVFGENYGPDLRYDFFTVRGFTPRQFVDGLAAPASTTIATTGVDLYGFESLDLLKGPASTLYGNVPPGGIFNQVSRRAAFEQGGEIRAQYGTDDFKEIAGTVTGPVADDLAVRFTGLYRDQDQIVDNATYQRLYVAPTATWRLGADTTLTGLAYYQYDKGQGGNGGFLPVQGTLLPNPGGTIGLRTNLADPRNVSTRRQFSAGYEFAHRFAEGVRFLSNSRWNRYRERGPIGIYATGLAADGRTASLSNFTYAEDVTSFTTDNRVEANVATGIIGHTLVGGVDYRNVSNVAAFAFLFAGLGTVDVFDPVFPAQTAANLLPGYPTSFNDQRLKQTGVYAQEQARIGDLFLTAGGRYDWVTVRAPADGARTRRNREERFTYRLGANYVTGSGIAPYLSYSTSFEPVLGTDPSGRRFDPSSGRQWEAGVKYDARGLPDGVRLFATAALFDIRQNNVVSVGNAATVPVFGEQVGEVRSRGGEVELVARIRDRWTVNGSYSYNDTEILDSGEPLQIGRPLPVQPRHKASLFVNYNVQSGALAGLGLGGGVRHTSSSDGSLPGPFNPVVFRGEAATLADALVSYDMPGWRLAVVGSNVFDARYLARVSGPFGAFYGAPRQVLFSVTRKFR